jgi:hypothetical protein
MNAMKLREFCLSQMACDEGIQFIEEVAAAHANTGDLASDLENTPASVIIRTALADPLATRREYIRWLTFTVRVYLLDYDPDVYDDNVFRSEVVKAISGRPDSFFLWPATSKPVGDEAQAAVTEALLKPLEAIISKGIVPSVEEEEDEEDYDDDEEWEDEWGETEYGGDGWEIDEESEDDLF